MLANEQSKNLSSQKNPLELLERQVKLLEDIREFQRLQLDQQKDLSLRVEQLQKAQEELHEELLTTEHTVAVTDFDMPFSALVGWLVKLAVAAIPATIIMAGLSAVIAFVLWSTLAIFTK
jgi:hypothetical protein